jgi:hypothetical protein
MELRAAARRYLDLVHGWERGATDRLRPLK